MNKFVLSIVVLAVVVLTLGSANLAYAQGPAQTPGAGTNQMAGRGFRGGMGGGYMAAGEGILHEYMIAALAEKLNLTATDLEARLANGETAAQIAASQGLTVDQFRALMIDARSQAIDQALNDGKLTQEQADWLKQIGAGQMGNARGMRGSGQGQYANPGCPYYNPTTP